MLYQLERRSGLAGGAARVIDQAEEVLQHAIGAGMPGEYLTGVKRDILHREIRRLQDAPASETVDRTILLSLGANRGEPRIRETILKRLPSFVEKLGEKWSDIFTAFATHPPLEEQEGETAADTDIRDEATTALAHAFPPEESLAFLHQYEPANFSTLENSTAIPIKRIIRAVRERIEWAHNHGDINAIREKLDTRSTAEQLLGYVGLHPDTDEDIGTIVLRVAENVEEIAHLPILVAAMLSSENSVGDVAATELACLIEESGGKMKPAVMGLLDEIPLDGRYSQSLAYLTTTIPALLTEPDHLRELYAMLMKKVPPVERAKTKQFDPLVVGEFCFGLENILHNTRARHYIETLFGDQATPLLEKLLHLYLNIPAENTMAIPRRNIISLTADIVLSNRKLAHDGIIKPLISRVKEGFDQATTFDDYEEDEEAELSWQRTESLAIGLLDGAATHFYS